METHKVKQINPWRSIWFSTRKTMRSILERDQKSTIILLAIINGIIGAFGGLSFLSYAYPSHPPFLRIPFALFLIILGIIGSLLYLYLGGWLFRFAGRWLKGKGNYSEVKCALGWSLYPSIIASIFHILNYVTKNHYYVNILFATLSLIVSIYVFIIFLKLLGEAHQFSAWRALGAYVIICIILFVIFMIILMLIPLLLPIFKA